MELVACPTCGALEVMTDHPLYCRGEGTFHYGHDYRMMTLAELDHKHTRAILAGHQIAAQRIMDAIEAIKEAGQP
jgi:hypothetical protein